MCDALAYKIKNIKQMNETASDFKNAIKRNQECNYLYNYVLANQLSFRLFGSELNFKAWKSVAQVVQNKFLMRNNTSELNFGAWKSVAQAVQNKFFM